MNIKLQQGLSLVELMVTLLVGLIVTFAVSNMLINSNRAALLNETLMEPQDSGRFLLSFMAREVRNSGRTAIAHDIHDNLYEEETDNFSECVGNDKFCQQNTNAGGDQDAFSTGDRLVLIARPIDGDILDCAGFSDDIDFFTSHPRTGVAFATDEKVYEQVLNTFWVEIDPVTGTHSFVCKSYRLQNDGSWLEQRVGTTPLAYNVEAMHVLYGENLEIPVDEDGNPVIPNENSGEFAKNERVVNRYVNASEVTEWDNVFAIKIAFLVRSESESLSRTERKYTLLDSQEYNFDDGYIRQIFSSTFALANYKTSTFFQ